MPCIQISTSSKVSPPDQPSAVESIIEDMSTVAHDQPEFSEPAFGRSAKVRAVLRKIFRNVSEDRDVRNSDDKDDVPAINDVESLKKGVIKTSENNQTSYTILLVGETGTGKSSFIEFIANVLLGKNVDDYDLEILDHGNEQGGSSGQSQTNSPRTYEFTSKNGISVRILDTPGLADTRGFQQDELHKESIATHIQEHIATINAVLVLASGSVSRITVGTDYALSVLSALFPKTLANNIAFLFTNSPTCLSFNFCKDAIPEILKDAPWFLLDNPIALQKNFLELKNDPIRKRGLMELREMVKHSEQKGLEILVELLGWLDSREPQPTTEIVSLYERSQAIETKITNALAQMDQAASKVAEISKLVKAVQMNSDMHSFSDFEIIITNLVWKQQPASTLNYLCTAPNCYSTCDVDRSVGIVLSLFPRQSSSCPKCNHPHWCHYHLHSTWAQVEEAQAVVDDNMKKQWEGAKDEKAKTAALVAASKRALEVLNCVTDDALDELAGWAAEYARLSLSGNFSAPLEKAIRLLEQRGRGMEEKGVSLEQLAKVQKSLEQMKERLDIIGNSVQKGNAWLRAWPRAKAAVMVGDVNAPLFPQLRVSTKGQAESRAEAEARAVACAWARGQGESVPLLADSSTIRDILSSLNLYGVARDLWHRSPRTRDEYSYIIQFIAPITRLPLELLHQIFLIIINESTGPPLVLMLVCKHWHAIVTTIWAPLNLGTRTPMGVVAKKLRRNQWFLDMVVDTESDRGDFTPSDSAFGGIFAAMEATSRWRSLVVKSFPGQADLPEHLVNRGLQQCSNATMSRLTTLKVKCACEASPLLDGLLRILGTTAGSKLTTMEIISENIISYLAPAYPSIFHSVKNLALDTLRIRDPVDLLPHLYQLETFTASHISFPIYHNDINLPFIHTLRHLSLRASSIQWMSGRTFHVLEHCTLIFPLHHHALHTFRTALPNCKHLTFQGFPLDILNGISEHKLVQLSVTCSGSFNGRGDRQLAQLSRRALGESQLTLKILRISIKATNRAWMNALAFMSNLEELEIHNAQPSSLGAKVFQLLVVQPAHAGNTPEEVGAPLCPLLRRLGLKYDRWLRQSEQFDLIPVFMSVIGSRKYSNCPLESFSLWIRNDQRDPLELIERSHISFEGFKRLAKESGIQYGCSDFIAAMEPFLQLSLQLFTDRDSDQRKQYKIMTFSRRKSVSQALQASISWFRSRF